MEFEQKEYIEYRNNPDDYFYCGCCGEIIMVDDMNLDDVNCPHCGTDGDMIYFFEG